MGLFWKFKRLLFRIKHGFYPEEVWDLNEYLIKFMLPRLRYFLNHYCKEDKVYREKVQKFVNALEKYDECDSLDDKIRENLNTFGDIISGLWD
jgi:hypothetical protein